MGTGQLINNEDVKDNSRKVGAGNSFAASFLTAAWQRPIKRRTLLLSPERSVSGAGTGGCRGAGTGAACSTLLAAHAPEAGGSRQTLCRAAWVCREQIPRGSERHLATALGRKKREQVAQHEAGEALHGAGEGSIARDCWISETQDSLSRGLRERGTWALALHRGTGVAGAAGDHGPCSPRCLFQCSRFVMPQSKY